MADASDSHQPGLPAPVRRYLAELVDRVDEVLGSSLVGVYLLGSAAMGGYRQGPSDLDVAVVTEGRIPSEVLRRLAGQVAHESLACPARGLELVIYTREAVGDPDAPPVYQLDLNTGAAMAPRMSTDATGEPGHWYTIDIAIGRAHGVALRGPPPDEVFAARPRRVVGTALEQSLTWHELHAPDHANAVLNASRAWRWAEEGIWSTKASAGRWAVERLDDPAPVRAALAGRPGGRPPALADEVIRRARAALGAVTSPR